MIQTMKVLSTLGFEDYELLDSGNGRRLERYERYVLNRPDPQAIWQPFLSKEVWSEADAVFEHDSWNIKKPMPPQWKISYKNISVWARLTPFKHTGVFPEQHLQWDWLSDIILNSPALPRGRIQDLKPTKGNSGSESGMTNESKMPRVLNLFGYTGAASLVAAASGAHVTHVDASKPAISWTKENQLLSKLGDKPIRWILDDAIKFVKREVRRGGLYDGIIMDPPAYGHGPEGEKWDFHESLPELLYLCKAVLSPTPLFIIINAYAISSSAIMLKNLLVDTMSSGSIEYGELAIQEKSRDRFLSTGIFARWSAKIK